MSTTIFGRCSFFSLTPCVASGISFCLTVTVRAKEAQILKLVVRAVPITMVEVEGQWLAHPFTLIIAAFTEVRQEIVSKYPVTDAGSVRQISDWEFATTRLAL